MFTVGQVVKKERVQSRITQEELSDGICTPSYLSRLENGKVNPSTEIVKLLLERLGKDYNKYITYKSEYEYKVDQLKFDIRRFHALREFDKCDKALEELEMALTEEDKFTRQFFLLYKVFHRSRNGASPEELIEGLHQALHITKMKIDLLRLSKEFLTQVEVVIIDHDQITRTHPIVLCNLCKWLATEKRYYECLAMCDYGLEYCIKYGFLDIFVDVNFYKGFALEHVGQIKLAKQFLVQSYYIARAMNSEVHIHLIKNYLMENHKEECLIL